MCDYIRISCFVGIPLHCGKITLLIVTISHAKCKNTHRLITSAQDVNNRKSDNFWDKTLMRYIQVLKTHDIGNIGVYQPCVLFARSGLNQFCFHELPCGGEEKYMLGLELSF